MDKRILALALSGLFLVACGGEENTDNETVVEETVEETCTYSYDPGATVLTWTAFKLTEKAAVNGSFDEINVIANDGESDMFAVLTGATFDIPVSTLNSQDDVRDPKIKKSFFGVMNETASITGTVNSIDANGASVDILMNGMTKSYEGEVTVEGEDVTFVTTIDILDFDGQASIDSLGVVCEAKHTGDDGVNKLWSDVDIAVKTTLVKTCK